VKNDIKLPRTVANNLATEAEEEQDFEGNSVLEYINSAAGLGVCIVEFKKEPKIRKDSTHLRIIVYCTRLFNEMFTEVGNK
jgi:hypothetical protein